MQEVISSYLLRHLQVLLFSLGQLWRQPLATIMTVTVIGIAIALPAGLYVLLQNINNVSQQWDESDQISLFLDDSLSDFQTKELSLELQTWTEISSIHYQSAQQSLDEFKVLSGLESLLDALPKNPLPAVIIVYPNKQASTPSSISTVLEKLRAIPQVEHAQLDMEWLQRLHSITQTIHRGITILGTLLSLSVLLIIGNTIRLAILSRQSEIRVMKLVGATDRFVRRPFLYTGFWYGFIGGLIAWLTLMIAMSLLSNPINQLIMQYESTFTLKWFSVSLLFILPSTASLLGILGAWLAVSRHIYLIEPN
jgi:cell division transport system permease protein